MRFRLPIILGLVVIAVCVMSSATAPKASAQTLPPIVPVYQPVVPVFYGGAPFVTGEAGVNFLYFPGGPQPDSCWIYDSWCGYCDRFPAMSACTTFPPGHMKGS
jgi:hypothetical protein